MTVDIRDVVRHKVDVKRIRFIDASRGLAMADVRESLSQLVVNPLGRIATIQESAGLDPTSTP